MNEKNKQLIKELALDLVSGDLVALAVDIGNAAVDFAKLNERVRKWWEVQPDKKVSALLKDISATLVDMILDGQFWQCQEFAEEWFWYMKSSVLDLCFAGVLDIRIQM